MNPFSAFSTVLTFSSLNGSTVRCATGSRTLVFFPEKGTDRGNLKDALMFLPTPEQEPSENTISWPGEYHEGGIAIRGVGHNEGKQVSYVVEIDGTRCAVLSLPLQDWTDHELEIAGDIDVLVLPSDGVKLAQKLVDEFDPRALLIVPGNDGKIDADLLRACGAQGKERTKEYKIKGSLPAEGRDIVVLAG